MDAARPAQRVGAQQAVLATRAYAGKAFQVLQHLGLQPGSAGSLHPLLAKRAEIRTVTVVLITSDRGLCGAYNTNMVRAAMDFVRAASVPVNFVAVGRKGRDLLLRRRQKLIAEFINLPGNPTFADVSAIGNLAVVVAAGLVWALNSPWPDLIVAFAVAGPFLQSAW